MERSETRPWRRDGAAGTEWQWGRMHCPRCGAALLDRRVSGIDVETCAECGGTWFDAGELDAHRAHIGMIAGGPSPVSQAFEAVSPDPWACPRCGTATLEAGNLAQCLIHRCASCGGVYLSKTELRNLSKSPTRRYAEAAVKPSDADAAPDVATAGWGEVIEWIEGTFEFLGGIFSGIDVGFDGF